MLLVLVLRIKLVVEIESIRIFSCLHCHLFFFWGHVLANISTLIVFTAPVLEALLLLRSIGLTIAELKLLLFLRLAQVFHVHQIVRQGVAVVFAVAQVAVHFES